MRDLTTTTAKPVAIIDSLGKHGGMHYYTDGLAQGLSRAGRDVIAYVTDQTGENSAGSYRSVVSFHRLYGSDALWRRAWRYLRGTWFALRHARRHGCDKAIFHLFGYGGKEAFSVWAARLLGLKAVLILHDIESFGRPARSGLRNAILRGADRLVVHNSFSLRELTRHAPAAAGKAVVIPHGHYADCFPHPPSRAEARQALLLPQDIFIALAFGNSRIEKGLDLLLEVAAQIDSTQDFLLVAAGKMKLDQEAFYRDLAARLGLAARIRFDVKFVPDEETQAYYAAADLVVVPYRRIYESGVTIMAMSLGRAVLASDLEPLRETTDDGRAGFLFAAGDAEALASKLDQLIGERARLDEVGQRARSHVLQTRDWRQIGELMAKALG